MKSERAAQARVVRRHICIFIARQDLECVATVHTVNEASNKADGVRVLVGSTGSRHRGIHTGKESKSVVDFWNPENIRGRCSIIISEEDAV